MQSQQQTRDKKILDEVRAVMRLHHYSIHTERSYCDWIRRFALYHRMQSRDDMAHGEQKIEAFLTHLAVDGNVAPATQNQAMNALVFLYKRGHQGRGAPGRGRTAGQRSYIPAFLCNAYT